MLNGANARLLSRFTGKDIRAEVSSHTCSFDLVGNIKKKRLKWLGHILRMKGPRLIKLAVKVQFNQDLTGDMFDALPRHLNFDEVVNLVQDRKLWKMLTNYNGDAQVAANIIKTTPPAPRAVTPKRSPERP